MIRLAVFDFDSTLMQGETIDILAQALGLQKEVSHITTEAMEGKLDFYDALVQRAKLLKGLPSAKVDEICANLPLTNGAHETVKGLKAQGCIVLCFSGGFRNATYPAAQKLGIDADFANFLHEKNGVLTGGVGGEMMHAKAKGQMLVRLQKLLGIDMQETMAVGDGANDLSMFEHAGVRVAFCAKEVLKREATHTIDTDDLTHVLDIAKTS